MACSVCARVLSVSAEPPSFTITSTRRVLEGRGVDKVIGDGAMERRWEERRRRIGR